VRVRARVTWDLLGYKGPVTLQILLTNDDGLHAPGLAVLRGALDGLGDVWTIAPDHDASAVARGITITRPLRVREERFGEGWSGFTCDGTPSDCVRVALVGVRCPVPDLVVSGVNAGSNMGADITYSGTVGAAFEAALRGFPALAFSVESETPGWLPEAAPVIRAVVGHVIARGLPQHTILNVNLPDRPLAGFTGIHPARLGGASCYDYVVLAAEDGRDGAEGTPTEYPVLCDHPPSVHGAETDFDVVAAGAVAVTPLSYDLLDPGLLAELASWDLDLEAIRA
jgi:5'-nucleotidase